jgi:hypothetical protein
LVTIAVVGEVCQRARALAGVLGLVGMGFVLVPVAAEYLEEVVVVNCTCTLGLVVVGITG